MICVQQSCSNKDGGMGIAINVDRGVLMVYKRRVESFYNYFEIKE